MEGIGLTDQGFFVSGKGSPCLGLRPCSEDKWPGVLNIAKFMDDRKTIAVLVLVEY